MSPMPALNSRAEAFRAEVADRSGIPSSFDQWRRSRSGRRWLVFAVTLASFSPGLASFLIDAPIGVSIGLGGAAFVANVWLRRERRRRLQAIVAWEEPADAG
jgi:Flp pilus assembly protein TadB